jgi:sugar phosphate isomerase/epimerase
MDIGLSSASFYPDINTEDSIGIMKNMGFDGGEIFLNTTSEYEDEFIEKLIEEREKNKFKIYSIHALSSSFEPFLFDKYKRRRKDMIDIFSKVCAAGNRLGAECYTFHGMRLMDLNYIDNKVIIDIYNELAYIALENGIKLAQENVSWCMSSNLDFLSMLKEKCSYPIYFTLDIKQAFKANESIDNYVYIMNDKLVNLHLNDRDKENVCLLPGKGQVDYEVLFNTLGNIGYSGKGIIEVYRDNYSNYNEIIESKRILEKI